MYRGKEKWLDMFIHVAVSFSSIFNYLCTERKVSLCGAGEGWRSIT
jgi:hypothetical protein